MWMMSCCFRISVTLDLSSAVVALVIRADALLVIELRRIPTGMGLCELIGGLLCLAPQKSVRVFNTGRVCAQTKPLWKVMVTYRDSRAPRW